MTAAWMFWLCSPTQVSIKNRCRAKCASRGQGQTMRGGKSDPEKNCLRTTNSGCQAVDLPSSGLQNLVNACSSMCRVQQSIANAENCNVERFKSETLLLRLIEKLSKARLPGRWLMRRRHVQQCIKVQVIPNVESKVVESRERFVVLQTSKETWNGFHASIDNVNLTSASERDVCQEFNDRLSMKRDVSGIKNLSENCVM